MTLQVVGRLRQINEAGAGGRLPTAVSAAAEMNERPKLVSRIRAASDCIWVYLALALTFTLEEYEARLE